MRTSIARKAIILAILLVGAPAESHLGVDIAGGEVFEDVHAVGERNRVTLMSLAILLVTADWLMQSAPLGATVRRSCRATRQEG